MRILVSGSRDFKDHRLIADTLSRQVRRERPRTVTLVHGNAPGADRVAAWYAARWRWNIESHPAQRNAYGDWAGWLRQREMVRLGADVCIAFVMPCDKELCPTVKFHGSHGPMGCVELAQEQGIETVVVFGGPGR